MPESVLILGAGGFIGRALTDAFSGLGIPTIAVGAAPPPFPSPRVRYLPGRIEGADEMAAMIAQSNKIVHLATTSTPGTSSARLLHEVETNLRFTASLIEALQAQRGKRLMYFSSGGSLYADVGQPSDEAATLRPRSYHGAAKLAAETFIAAWCAQYDGSAAILRPSNVYGPGQPEKPGFGVIPAAMGKLLRHEPLHIWGDGSARRDYVYIDDLVRLCAGIFATTAKPGVEILNACSGESTSVNELLDALEQATGLVLERIYERSRAVDASNIAMDPSAAMETYGWRHQTSLVQGLARSWEWFQREYAA